MQKILVTFLLFILVFLSAGGVFTADAGETTIMADGSEIDNTAKKSQTESASKSQTVIVSEKVPGANCVPDASLGPPNPNTPVYERKYICTIEPGLAGFQQMFATIIRWFVNIVMLAGVLAIVGLGIAWSLAGGDDANAKSELKKWGINILVGMIILFFFRYILQFLAPWIYK